MSSSNKGPAMDRITALLDDHSFVEIGGAVRARSTDFSIQEKDAPSDGVICGYGTIGDRLVFVYSQDAEVLGGSIGEMHAGKIASLYDQAQKTGAPIIGMLDSSGIRLEEGADSLEGLGVMMAKAADASGIIPQISVVFGTCGGGLSTFASMSDIILMEESASFFFNSPNAIEGNFKEKSDTSSAAFRAASDGVVDFIGSQKEILDRVRSLVNILPGNCDEGVVELEYSDDLNRGVSVSAGSKAADIAAQIADAGTLIELKKSFAECMFTGLCQLGGMTVGIYGNNADEICANGAAKAAFFVNFCDAFSIPLLSLTKLQGFKAKLENEKRIGRALARLTTVTASASVPKVNVLIGKNIGSAYLSMNSKAIGADVVFALEGATLSPMEAGAAARIICPDGDTSACAAQYEKKQGSLEAALSRGYVDRIITDADARKYIISAFQMLATKAEAPIIRKHPAK